MESVTCNKKCLILYKMKPSVITEISIKRNNTNANWCLVIPHELRLIEQLKENYLRSDEALEVILSARITSEYQNKSTSQLGYLFAQVIPSALRGFQQLGFEMYGKEDARRELQLMFLYEDVMSVVFEGKLRQPRSLAKCSKSEVAEFIDNCIRFIQMELGEAVETPEEYKKRMGFENWTK